MALELVLRDRLAELRPTQLLENLPDFTGGEIALLRPFALAARKPVDSARPTRLEVQPIGDPA